MKSSRYRGLLTSFVLTAFVLTFVLTMVSQAQTYTVLHTFKGTDGANPEGALIQDAAGNSYGTTFERGASGYGTVFKLSPKNKRTVLYNFPGPPDGANPAGTLLLDSAGNLYGTTVWGGTANLGTVFKINASGQETLLYSFAGGSDGANPESGVIADAAGNLYGSTQGGGSGAGCTNYSCGTIFEINSSGSESVLYTFNGDTASGVIDGANPWGGLVRDSAGNLYGTTIYGGTAGFGTIFKITSSGTETLVHQFSGASDGAYPYSTLVFDSTGNLYGTAYEGGSGQVGTVFKVDSSENLTVLHNFLGGATDGGYPAAGVVIDASGNLYGTTAQGGSANYGTIFEIDSAGDETVLHSFTGYGKGSLPEAGLFVDKAGDLYGTTYYGGPKDASFGSVFEFVP